MEIGQELLGKKVGVKVAPEHVGFQGPFIYYEGTYRGVDKIPGVDQSLIILDDAKTKIHGNSMYTNSSKLAAVSTKNLISIESLE